jgi:hypothetical protein
MQADTIMDLGKFKVQPYRVERCRGFGERFLGQFLSLDKLSRKTQRADLRQVIVSLSGGTDDPGKYECGGPREA